MFNIQLLFFCMRNEKGKIHIQFVMNGICRSADCCLLMAELGGGGGGGGEKSFYK